MKSTSDRYQGNEAYRWKETENAQELSSLLRFSLRFSRSTRLWCIFSAIFSYRAFSSLAARRSLIFWMRAYMAVSWNHTTA